MIAVSMTTLCAAISLAVMWQGDQRESDPGRIRWEELGATVKRNERQQLIWLEASGPKIKDVDVAHCEELGTLTVLLLETKERDGDGCGLTDAALTRIGDAHNILTLQLRGKGFTDHALPGIGRLTSLRTLELSGTRVTDEGLKHLRHLSLKWLDLSGSRVNGKGLSHIQERKRLVHLDLDNTLVDDEGVGYAAEFRSFEGLFLRKTRITDRGLKRISRLPALKRLDLDATAITDVGTSYLETMKGVELLSLTDTMVSDAAVPSLAQLSGLRDLDLSGTQMTPPGLERL